MIAARKCKMCPDFVLFTPGYTVRPLKELWMSFTRMLCKLTFLYFVIFAFDVMAE